MSTLCPCAAALSWALTVSAGRPALVRALLISEAISLMYPELLLKLQLAGPLTIEVATGVPFVVGGSVLTGAAVTLPIKILSQKDCSIPIGSVSPLSFFNI